MLGSVRQQAEKAANNGWHWTYDLSSIKVGNTIGLSSLFQTHVLHAGICLACLLCFLAACKLQSVRLTALLRECADGYLHVSHMRRDGRWTPSSLDRPVGATTTHPQPS